MTGKKVVAGFDGYIDRIFKATKRGEKQFTDISEFGNYLIGKHPRSCYIQLVGEEKRMGGNAPLFTRTLRNLVPNVKLYGMLGQDEILPVFSDLTSNGKNVTFMNPAETLAIEFSGSKLFLAPKVEPTDNMISTLDEAGLKEDILSADLTALLNWGELDFMNNIWEHIAYDFIESSVDDKNKYVFVDLADFSRHDKNRMDRLWLMLKTIARKRTLFLGLNGNELGILCDNLGVDKGFPENAKIVSETLGGNVMIHTKMRSSAFSLQNDDICSVEVRILEAPRLSTGAGDNFNAGFCYGILSGKDIRECLELGNTCAYMYMKTGSPVENEAELIKLKHELYNEKKDI